MKKFSEEIKRFIKLKKFSDQYRLCWIPSIMQYSIIELFDNELHLIDKNKIEIIK